MDSPVGTGVEAPFTPDALNTLSDLGIAATFKAPQSLPWMSVLTLIRGPLSSRFQANSET